MIRKRQIVTDKSIRFGPDGKFVTFRDATPEPPKTPKAMVVEKTITKILQQVAEIKASSGNADGNLELAPAIITPHIEVISVEEHNKIIEEEKKLAALEHQRRLDYEKQKLKEHMNAIEAANQDILDQISNEHQRKLQELASVYNCQLEENKRKMAEISKQYEFSLQSLEAEAEDQKKETRIKTQELEELQKELEKLRKKPVKKLTLKRTNTKLATHESQKP